jgi:hypothetical protein
MNTFNRTFVALLALAWLAALAGVLYLVWEQSRTIDIDTQNLVFNFDVIMSGRAEKILASLILMALAIPALGLLAAEFLPRRARGDLQGMGDAHGYEQLQGRIDALQKQLDSQRQAQPVERTEDREVTESREPRRRWGFLAHRQRQIE